jgi:hypothetical protein
MALMAGWRLPWRACGMQKYFQNGGLQLALRGTFSLRTRAHSFGFGFEFGAHFRTKFGSFR